MKIAIVSDLHIGYERFYEDAHRQAKEALEKAGEMADMILIPGDVFDKRAPKPEVIAQAINIFRELSRRHWKAKVVDFKSASGAKPHTDVPIIAIPGTHERTAEGKENVLQLLALAGLIVDASEATCVVEKDGEKVAVFGLGGISEERVMEILVRLNPKPVPGMFNIFMMHQSTYELLPFSEDFIHQKDLPDGFDLYVNGHIHSRVESVVHGKKFLIPGSTVLTQLKDNEQEEKGFILFDTKDSTYKFVPIKSRPFFAVHIKLDDASPKDVTQKCESEIEKALAKHRDMPIIKIYLEGTLQKGFNISDMPVRNIIQRFSGKSYLEIDSSKMKSPETEKSVEQLRSGMVHGMTIKELGMSTFVSKLKEQKLDDSFDAGMLFEILSSDKGKEKVVKEANELLDKTQN